MQKGIADFFSSENATPQSSGNPVDVPSKMDKFVVRSSPGGAAGARQAGATAAAASASPAASASKKREAREVEAEDSSDDDFAPQSKQPASGPAPMKPAAEAAGASRVLSKCEREAVKEEAKREKKAKQEARQLAKDSKQRSKEVREAERQAKAALPKKPRTAYVLFCVERRSDFTSKHPELPNIEVNKLIGQAWAVLDEEVKSVYDIRVRATPPRPRHELLLPPPPSARPRPRPSPPSRTGPPPPPRRRLRPTRSASSQSARRRASIRRR